MNSKTRLRSPSFSECEIEIHETSICLNWAGVLVQYFKNFTQRGFFHKSTVYYSLASQVLIVLYTLVWNDPFNFLLRFFELALYSKLEGQCSVESYNCFERGLLCNRRILNKCISGCLIAYILNTFKTCFSKILDTIDKVCIFCTYAVQSDEELSSRCWKSKARTTMRIEVK